MSRVIAAAFVLAVLVPGPAVAQTSSPSITLTLGSQGAGDGQFMEPTAIAIASDGEIYVADNGLSRVQRFSATGVFLGKWGSFGSSGGNYLMPTGIAVDDEAVWVADSRGLQIARLSRSGEFVQAFTVTWMGRMLPPNRISVAPDGSLYVTSNTDVAHVSRSGQVLGVWGRYGTGPGEFTDATGIAAGESRVYVVDRTTE